MPSPRHISVSRQALAGISIVALSCGLAAKPALAGSLISLNTGATIATGTNVAITNATNPVYDNTSGTATSPTITYAGAGNAAITIGGTLAASSGNTALSITGNNSHGSSDVTSGITFTGTATTSGAASGVNFDSTGTYNFFIVGSGGSVTSGTSGTNAAITASAATSMNISNNGGTITGQSGLAAVQNNAGNTGSFNFTNSSGTTTTSGGTGAALNIVTGGGAFDASATISGGTLSSTGTGSAIQYANAASSGDSITVSGGTVSNTTGTAATINVQTATNAASTINLSSGAIANGAGATGLAIYVGQAADTVNITGGTLTGKITTSTGGDGIVNLNASGFSTNGDFGVNGTNLAAVNINGGSVTLNNNIYSTIAKLNGGVATVAAGATINSPTLQFSGGTLALGTNTLGLANAVSLTSATAGSTLDFTIGATTNGRLSGGTVTNNLAAGGQTLTIDPTVSGKTLHSGDEYTVIHGTNSYSNLAIANSGSLLAQWSLGSATTGKDAYGFNFVGNNVVAIYNVADAHSVTSLTHDEANTINAAINSAPSSVSNALLALTTAPQLAHAGQQLGSESNRASIEGAYSATGGVMNTIAGRLDAVRGGHGSGFSSGEDPDHLGVWMQGFGGNENQGSRDGADGYQSLSGGVAAGADRLVARNTRAGASFAYAHTSVSDTGQSSGDNTGINSYLGTLYGSYQGAPWYVDAAAGYGYHRYDTSRLVEFTGFADNATASHSGYQYTAKLDGGYPIDLNPVTLTPTLGVTYIHLDQSRFTETSSNGAALAVSGESSDSIKSSVGGKVETSFMAGGYKITPQANAAWLHEFDRAALTTNDSYVGGTSSFTIGEIRPALDSALVGVGLTVKTTDDLSLTASFESELRAGYESNTGILQLRANF